MALLSDDEQDGMGGEDDLDISNSNKKESIKKCKKKWIDDLTIANVIDLKDCKKVTEDNLIRPLNFHGRTEHVLYPESNPAQKELAEIFALAQEKQMVVNRKKTKAMIFNPSRNIDFQPFLYDPNGETIDYVQQTKLLGVIILEDLRTELNTKNIETKAYRRIWYLKRLIIHGCPIEDLVTVYVRQVRSVCEYAVQY